MSKAMEALNWAKTKIGANYSQADRWGANTFDCSSLVYRAFLAAGVKMVDANGAAVSTSTTEVNAKGFDLLWPSDRAQIGKQLPSPSTVLSTIGLQAGDLIFYNHTTTTRANNITHVSMYVGDGRIIHARNPKLGVRYDPYSYMNTNVCAVTRYAEQGAWRKVDGQWSYLASGKAVTGWQQLPWSMGTDWFYFDAEGVMLTGWQKVNGRWYFMDNSSGAMQTGWYLEDDKYYYLTSTGAMATNAAVIAASGNKVWVIGADGVMQPNALPIVK